MFNPPQPQNCRSISRFVNFSRFMIVMAFLHSQEISSDQTIWICHGILRVAEFENIPIRVKKTCYVSLRLVTVSKKKRFFLICFQHGVLPWSSSLAWLQEGQLTLSLAMEPNVLGQEIAEWKFKHHRSMMMCLIAFLSHDLRAYW